jgi:hypothetical protein
MCVCGAFSHPPERASILTFTFIPTQPSLIARFAGASCKYHGDDAASEWAIGASANSRLARSSDHYTGKFHRTNGLDRSEPASGSERSSQSANIHLGDPQYFDRFPLNKTDPHSVMKPETKSIQNPSYILLPQKLASVNSGSARLGTQLFFRVGTTVLGKF